MKKVFILSVLLVLFLATAAFAANTPAPKSGKAKELYEKAITSAYHGNYKEAMEGFKKVTEMEPAYAPAYNGWGLCLTSLTRYKDAAEKFRKATALDPQMGKAYYNWGNALANMDDNQGAVEKYKKAARLEPKFAPAYNGWGLSLTELGRYDEAIEKFRKAAKLNPADADKINKVIANVQKLKNERSMKGTKKR